MEKVVIGVGSYRESFERLRDELNRRTVDLNRRHIVIVPENFTLFTEKLLFSGGGALDVQVCSFSRLFSRPAEAGTYLPRNGAVMLLKRVIMQNKDRLRFFHRSARFKGFAEKMYDTVHLLSRCAVRPSDLKESGLKDGKIGDIRLIYEEYLKAAQGRFIDATGRMLLLGEEIDRADLSDAFIYLAGFDGFSKQETLIIDKLAARSIKTLVYETESCAPDFSRVKVRMFSCAGDADRLKAIAKRIRYAVLKEGAEFGDICIVVPPPLHSQAIRIMSEFGIPLHLDKKTFVGDTMLAAYAEGLFRLESRNFSFDDVIRFSKNYFLGVDKTDADVFENYCVKYCIDYSKFLSPFEFVRSKAARDASFEHSAGFEFQYNNELCAERVRRKIVSVAAAFKRYLKERFVFGRFTGLIEFVLNGCDAQKRSEELSAATGCDVTNIAEKISACAALLDGICGDGGYSLEDAAEMFFEGLASLSVSSIPKVRDAVAAGDANGFRAGGYKYMFVADFSDGSTPQYADDSSLISDADIDRLAGEDILIAPKISALNERSLSNFFFAATEVKYLFLGYSDEGAKRISSASIAIRRTARDIRYISFESENALLQKRADVLSDNQRAHICRLCSTKSHTLEMLLLSMSDLKDGGSGCAYGAELADALGGGGAERFLNYSDGAFSGRLAAKGLFFKNNLTSVTNLQDYFMCPQYNFLKNGLRLREREDGKLSALDAGNILHKTIEEITRNSSKPRSNEEILSLVDKYIKEYSTQAYDARNAVVERLYADALEINAILTAQNEHSKFIPFLFEERFPSRDGKGLRSVAFDSGEREITLSGSIDRADVYNGYARIVDYKTGRPSSSEFDFQKAYFGRQLQLPLYMRVMLENGYKAGGMFYFPCQTYWSDDAYSHRLSGLCNNKHDVVTAMDSSLAFTGVKSAVINAKSLVKPDPDTGLSVPSGSGLFDEAQIERLCDYAYKIAQNAVREIESGYAETSPLDGSCSFCTFKAACPQPEKNRKTRTSFSVKAESLLAVFDGSKSGASAADGEGNADGSLDIPDGDKNECS